MAYETQRGATVFDKEPHIYSEYERNILNKIPVQELLTVYQDITEADYGPLEDWQLIAPISDYSETALDTMSALDYLEDLTEKNKIILYSGSDILSGNQYLGGQSAPFRPDLNPDLTEGPDTVFVRDYQDEWKWDTPEFKLDTILHELGHAHTVPGLETRGDRIEKGGREGLLTHNSATDRTIAFMKKDALEEHDIFKSSQEIWNEKMNWFISKYVE